MPSSFCTDADVVPKPEWRKRKEEYIAHILTALPSVRLVSAADKLHNARAILRDYRIHGEDLWTRFNGGKDVTLWYYRALVKGFSAVERNELIEELDRMVSEIESLNQAARSHPSSSEAVGFPSGERLFARSGS